MKKIIITLFFLFSINIAQAATIDIQTGRNLIINNEIICLDNVSYVLYLDNNTTFFLLTGGTKAIPTTVEEFIKIQQLLATAPRSVAVPSYGYYDYYRNIDYQHNIMNNQYYNSGNQCHNEGHQDHNSGSSVNNTDSHNNYKENSSAPRIAI